MLEPASGPARASRTRCPHSCPRRHRLPCTSNSGQPIQHSVNPLVDVTCACQPAARLPPIRSSGKVHPPLRLSVSYGAKGAPWPVQAAAASALSLTSGAPLPLLSILLPRPRRGCRSVTFAAVLIALGGSGIRRAVLRVVIGGAAWPSPTASGTCSAPPSATADRVTALAACSAVTSPKQPQAVATSSGTTAGHVASRTGSDGTLALPRPATLSAFPGTRPYADEGVQQPAGRLVGGKRAVYQTPLVPPADGDLVYVVGSHLDPLPGRRSPRAGGAVRGRQLYINSSRPAFACFRSASPDGLAAPSSGTRLIDTSCGPTTFLDPATPVTSSPCPPDRDQAAADTRSYATQKRVCHVAEDHRRS